MNCSYNTSKYPWVLHFPVNNLYDKGRAGGSAATDEFLEKFQREGEIFNPKNYVADFGNSKQGFLSTNMIQTSQELRMLSRSLSVY